MDKSLLTISDEARDWLNNILGSQDDIVGVHVSINKKGCAGGEYVFRPVKAGEDMTACDKITDNGVTLFVPRTQILNLIGAELVLFKDRLNQRLDFKNPNEADRCGCGESISFKPDKLIHQ